VSVAGSLLVTVAEVHSDANGKRKGYLGADVRGEIDGRRRYEVVGIRTTREAGRRGIQRASVTGERF
jgi:hypothetical protein